MAWASGGPRTRSGPTANGLSATSASPRNISFAIALDAVDSNKAVPSSQTPTRPSTLSQYLVENLLHMMISNHIMEYIVHGWCERAEDEDVIHYDRPRASEESA